ncbi:MAG: hypothetical protein RIC15_12325 [Vicingaceae bacterium]
MNTIVTIIAIVILSIGISIIIHPSMLKGMLHQFLLKKWLWPVSVLRVGIGLLLVYTSGQTSFPVFVGIFGYALILAGLSVPLLGSHRVDSMAIWWLNQKDYMIRLWGLIALFLGITLAMAVN